MRTAAHAQMLRLSARRIKRIVASVDTALTGVVVLLKSENHVVEKAGFRHAPSIFCARAASLPEKERYLSIESFSIAASRALSEAGFLPDNGTLIAADVTANTAASAIGLHKCTANVQVSSVSTEASTRDNRHKSAARPLGYSRFSPPRFEAFILFYSILR